VVAGHVAGMRLPSFCAENGIPLSPDTMDRIFSARPARSLRDHQPEGRHVFSRRRRTDAHRRGDPRDQNTVLSISSLVQDYYGIDNRSHQPADCGRNAGASNGSCAWDLSPHEPRRP